MITLLLLVRATYMYGVVLHAHPVRGESHNQRNTTGVVATTPLPSEVLVTLQIDESVVAKRPRFFNRQATSVEPQWVFGGVDSTTRYFETSAFYSNENYSTYLKMFVK